MSKSFFQEPGHADDESYCAAKFYPEARRFTEELWQEFSERALDEPNFLSNAKSDFHAAFWEMYLGVVLQRSDQNPKRKSGEGPDFLICVNGQRIWFEAVAPTPGEGDDAVRPIIPLSKGGRFQRVPREQMILRITNAVSKKQCQFQKAIEEKIAKDSDGLVIAINGYRIRNVPEFDPLTLLWESLLGVEGPCAHFYKDNAGNVHSHSEYIHREEIQKQSGAPVSTTRFLSGEAKSVSAVLYSNAQVGDARMESHKLGADFILLHNPCAAVSIPIGLIPIAKNECWVDKDSSLRCLKED